MAKLLTEIATYCDSFFLKSEQNLIIADQKITHLKIDSRTIQANDLFVARSGIHLNGNHFILQAIEKGAVAIFCEGQQDQVSLKIIQNKPILYCEFINLDEFLPNFTEWFYDFPSRKMPLIGVTGTNGKTTITQLISQWSNLLKVKSGSIGTLGYSFSDVLVEGKNTTPDLIEIEDWLDYCISQQAEFVVMEISSHGLALNRVKPLHFDIAIFTNLTRDHLDFHSTLEAYEEAKWGLFSSNEAELKVKSVAQKIINIDDEVGKNWATKLPDAMLVSIDSNQLSSLKKSSPRFMCAKTVNYKNGIEIELESHLGSGILSTSLIGEFNASNLLLAFSALLLQGYCIDELLKTASMLTPICGRMQSFVLQNKALAIVDYAHTPDALEKALKTIKMHSKGKIITVFGCGGNRDKGKRILMGQVADYLSDEVIVTDDNPREEDPDQIILDIKTGFTKLTPIIIRDRTKAIEYGLSQLKAGDALLIAGKGHENYQIIGTTKHSFSDQLVILNWMEQQNDKN